MGVLKKYFENMSGAEIIFHKNRHSSYWSVQNILRAYKKFNF